MLEARAQLAIDAGNLFPQQQQMTGDYTRTGLSERTANNFLNFGIPGVSRFFSQWNYGFNLSWELDFWGRFRRAVESDADTLEASVENYDDVLVTLVGDMATNYVNYRTFEQRIKYAEDNVELQRETLAITEARFKAGTVSELDVAQARSTLEQTQATIPELRHQHAASGQPDVHLARNSSGTTANQTGISAIPTAPVEVAVGIPAELLRRRPDIRRAERQAAAQCAEIGVAESDFYPHIAITGTIGYSAQEFKDLFRESAFNGTIGPSFQWNILNYGRILNNVRLQDAKFQELVTTYQSTVLNAAQEVENGLVTFLQAQERVKYQAASADDAERAVKLSLVQYKAGTVDFTRVTQLELNLVPLQDVLATAQGEIGTGLIQVYKGLGGGWQIRFTGCDPGNSQQLGMPRTIQNVPAAKNAALPPARALLGAPVEHQ